MLIDHVVKLIPQQRNTWLYMLVMPRARFRVILHCIVAWMSRNSMVEPGAMSEF